MLLEAVYFISEKHKSQKRMGGAPYVNHPIAVARILKRKNFPLPYILAGLFHDLLEDTDATEDEILSLSNEEVLKAVKLCTKENGYCEDEYFRRIKQNDMVRMVKLADRLYNLKSAMVASKKFRKRYIENTKKFYLDMAEGTIFEVDIVQALKELEKTLQ